MSKKTAVDDMSLLQFLQQVPDDATAERRFIAARWPDGIICPLCQSTDVQEDAKHPTMPYHCRECRHYFSVKTNSIMHSSKLGYQQLAKALYLLTTSKKGISATAAREHLEGLLSLAPSNLHLLESQPNCGILCHRYAVSGT